jgi:methionyl-tRNA formyltransferase
MNIVFLADAAPGNAWLIRAVQQQVDYTAPRPAGTYDRRRQPARPLSLPERAARSIRRRFFSVTDRRERERLTHLLFGADALPSPGTDVLHVPAWNINGDDTAARIATLAPDLMIVSGAPILAPKIFDIPRLGTLNLHFGISPAYRGMHTIVTPWQRDDFAHVGATLHVITAGIDDGPVLCRVYPALDADDDHVTAEAKIVRLATTTLCEMLRDITSQSPTVPLRGAQLTGDGALIRYHDRSIRRHLRAQLRRVHPPRQDERVERFYQR